MSKIGSQSSGNKTTPGPELLRLALRSLRLRYQCVAKDIQDWERLHASHLLEKQNKQFYSVTARIGMYEDLSETMQPDSQPADASPGIDTGRATVEEYETQIATDFTPEDIPGFLNFYKKWSAHLSGRTDLPRLSQPEIGFQTHWEYFRQALQQRLVPQYGYFLDKVDIIARDCYYPLLKAIEALTDKELESEQGWLSPLTVLKFDTLYYTLSTRYAPIPYIFVPFDRMNNIWNLCAIHHEVAHDFFHKLNYLVDNDPGDETPPVATQFRKSVEQRMENLSLNEAEAAVAKFAKDQSYLNWLEEIFADFIGLILAGPVYLHSLQEILIEHLHDIDPNYPPTSFRILLNIIITRDKLGLKRHAQNARDRWFAFYSKENMMDDIQQYIKKKKQEDAVVAFHQPQATIGPLTFEGVENWLTHLVDSCWQSPLTPALTPDDNTLTLKKIHKQIVLAQHKTYPTSIRGKGPFKDQQRLETVNDITNKNIFRAQEHLYTLKRAECRPRHLVPAVRLAYEAWALKKEAIPEFPDYYEEMEQPWDETIRDVFFDSVRELPEVADTFKRLEKAWNWAYDYGGEGNFWDESRIAGPYFQQMPLQTR